MFDGFETILLQGEFFLLQLGETDQPFSL